MDAGPRAERLGLPPEYGSPSRLLAWESVRSRLEAAPHYWLSSVRPDGRPHTVPVDGLWIDGGLYFGGSERTVKHRNLLANHRATAHLEDAASAVIVEGVCEWGSPGPDTAAELSRASKGKYGYGPPPSSYLEGVWRLVPVRVLAWSDLTTDATRFVFA
jgi:hypothetical protein